MKRKLILVLCAVLLVLVCAIILWRCCHKQAKIVYYNPYTGVSFQEELSSEEAENISKILHAGRSTGSPLFSVAACGFSNRIYITVNGIKYYPALDGCNRLLNRSTLQYISISAEQRDYLDQLFATYGGTFPCV